MVSLKHEQEIWSRGIKLIAFCDEVGRGPLLGSVIAASVILPEGLIIDGVNDSKKLTCAKRELLYQEILKHSLAVGIGEVDNQIIDRINIKQASRLAMKESILNLRSWDGIPVKPEYLLVDAETVDLDIPQQGIIHGDAVCHGIAAASIVAKVTRDRKCLEWDSKYPGYGIASHKGYCTKAHVQALLAHGPTPIHRSSFLRKIIERATHEQQILFEEAE